MTIDPKNPKHLIADDGKIIRRIEDKKIYGFEVYLGYTYSIGGVTIDPPRLEKPEDFEEIDYEPEPPEPINVNS